MWSMAYPPQDRKMVGSAYKLQQKMVDVAPKIRKNAKPEHMVDIAHKLRQEQ